MERKLTLLCVFLLGVLIVKAQGGMMGSTERSALAAHTDSHRAGTVVTAIANPAEGGEITGAGEYNAGDDVTLTAIPNKDFVFLNWSENGEVLSTDNPYTFFIEEDPEPPIITFDRMINHESVGIVEPGRYEIIGDVDDMYELKFVMDVINNGSESINLTCERNIVSITEGAGHNFCFVSCFPDGVSSTEVTIEPLSSMDPDVPYYPYEFSAHFKPYDANTWELLPAGAELTVQYTFTMSGEEPMVFEFYFRYDPSLSKNTDIVVLSDNERTIFANFGSFTAPTDATATVEGSTSVILTWAAVEYALSYNIYRDGNLIDNVSTTSYTDKDIEPYSEYCYTLTAVRNETETEHSETICVTTEDLPISVPTNLTAEAESASTIVLAWDAVENALSYNVYRGGEFLTNVTEAAYTDEGLESLTEYCYTVSAVRNVTETAQTESVCATTFDLPITAPTNLAATLEGERMIILTWDAVENAYSYNVYRNGEFLTNVELLSCSDEGLEYETEYCYTVTAVPNETESEHSDEVCVTTLPDGISENEISFEFYPNPVNEVLIINTDREIEEISVYNISGSMIYQSDMIEGTTLNVSSYDEGTYLLRVKIDDKYITRTFIKR